MEAPEELYIRNYNADTWGNQWHTRPSVDPNVVNHRYVRADLAANGAPLAWTDIREILSIADEVAQEKDCCVKVKYELCEEVLRRFTQKKKQKP